VEDDFGGIETNRHQRFQCCGGVKEVQFVVGLPEQEGQEVGVPNGFRCHIGVGEVTVAKGEMPS
jgi:hypothetical protein